MTNDDLMRQSAEALLRWIKDKTLPVEFRTRGASKWISSDGFIGWNIGDCDYRIAAPPKRVPLGPEDFPPGQVHCIRCEGWNDNEYRNIIGVSTIGIRVPESGYNYMELMDHFQRWIDGKWQPCWKEVTE